MMTLMKKRRITIGSEPRKALSLNRWLNSLRDSLTEQEAKHLVIAYENLLEEYGEEGKQMADSYMDVVVRANKEVFGGDGMSDELRKLLQPQIDKEITAALAEQKSVYDARLAAKDAETADMLAARDAEIAKFRLALAAYQQ